MNKSIHFDSNFKVKSSENEDEIIIKGYASTTDKDRHGDVILAEAWKNGLEDYKENPIILHNHNYNDAIGVALDISVDKKGLGITAMIHKSAGKAFDLVKSGILSTFSVGFRVKDADYDMDTDIFVIKEAELFEISVVAVPANGKATFSVAKSFESKQEAEEFKNSFIKQNVDNEETLMTDKNKAEDVKDTPAIDEGVLASKVTESVLKSLEERARKEAEEKEAARKAAEALSVQVKSTAEELVKEVTQRFESENSELKDTISELKEALAANRDEMVEIQNRSSKSAGLYTGDAGTKDSISKSERMTAVLLSKAFGKEVDKSKYFADLATKSNREHLQSVSGDWEEEWNTTVEQEMREKLVVEPLFTTIPMNTPVMNYPINPEAGEAGWVHSTSFTGSGSTHDEQKHQITDASFEAYKLATKEYIGYEEEEDTIIAIAPIIQEAVSRRMANASDKAVLRGTGVTTAGSSFDPITGLVSLGETTISLGSAGTAITETAMIQARKDLGVYGDIPSDLVWLVNRNSYYNILQIEDFKTVDTAPESIATLFKGTVGSIWGTPIVLCDHFGDESEAVATLVNPSNFKIGSLRGLMAENDRNIEEQKRIIVASRRFAFTDIIPNRGCISLKTA